MKGLEDLVIGNANHVYGVTMNAGVVAFGTVVCATIAACYCIGARERRYIRERRMEREWDLEDRIAKAQDKAVHPKK